MRIWMGLLGGLGIALLATHRSGLSVAIVRMAKYNSSDIVHDESSGQCFEKTVVSNSSDDQSIIRGEFDWNESLQGIILGANFYPYFITPIVAGRITDMFGAKWLTLVSMAIPAAIVALLPTAAYYSVYLMIALLVIQGFFQGCVLPALFSLYSNWYTPSERTVAIAGIAAGSDFGSLIAFSVGGYLCDNEFWGGWPSAFYVFSLAHIPWIILWILIVEDTPVISNTSGFVKCSNEELKYIQSNNNSIGAPKKTSSAPWLKIFTSKCFWASSIGKIAGRWGYYLLNSKLPAYLDKVFGMSLLHNGLFNAGKALSAGIAMVLWGPLSALLIRKTSKRVSITTIRKLFQAVSLLGPALCLTIITLMGCDSIAVVVLMTTALFLYGFMTGGEFPIVSEYAPDYSGTLSGMTQALSMWPAFVAPYVVGVMLDDSPGERRRWNEIFYLTIGIYVFGALVFLFCASAEPQEWGLIKNDQDKPYEDDKEEENNNQIKAK